MSDLPEWYIRKSHYFEETFAACVPDKGIRGEIERGIRFALSHFPEHGKFTGQSAPLPIYTWKILHTPQYPALTVFYTFGVGKLVLISVRLSGNE